MDKIVLKQAGAVGHVAKNHQFWSDNVVLGFSALLVGVFNYLYHVVLAHVLGPHKYGDLTTFLNVTSFLVMPASVVVLIYTRLGKRPRPAEQRDAWWLWGIGVVSWAAIWVFAGPLSRTFHVSQLLLIIFTAEVVPSLALAANTGILQNARRYLLVGALAVLNGLFRVVAASSALWPVYRLVVVGGLEGAAAWVTWVVSRRMVRTVPVQEEATGFGMVTATGVVAVINVLYAIVDGLAAKYALPPEIAGQYTGMAIMGHSIDFVSGSLATVMLTAMLSDPSHRYSYLGLTVAVYGLLAGLVQWIFIAHGARLVIMILGPRFLAIAPWIPSYGWGMIGLGLLNIAMFYSIAQSRWEVITTTGCGLLVWTWTLVHDHTLRAFTLSTAHILVATVAATGVVMGVTLAVSGYGRVGREGPEVP
ncbi:capsular biosynthesis protein [Sulfobacillus thermotolerans]|uniref:Capsular biosynthesis protein n=1 Tax=Sulfobacillus thermotolerans TaxID=338644 RepID=A0ABM6RW17_9FIRM|nr:capsular biosynthesis protein [Sulfobacillus thermotolerans]